MECAYLSETNQDCQLSDTVLVDLHYLPSLEYFACLLKYEHVLIEAHENYQKQSYRNRCHILAANQVDVLSIPILDGRKNVPIREVKIDYSQRWLNDHWRGIASAYGKAPYFEYYAHFFEEILFKKYTYLFDLNRELLTKCLTLLKIDKNFNSTSEYVKTGNTGCLDLRSAIHPKKNYANNKIYAGIAYVQNFGSTFVPNLSIIDLLFCEGPRARQLIEQSVIRS